MSSYGQARDADRYVTGEDAVDDMLRATLPLR